MLALTIDLMGEMMKKMKPQGNSLNLPQVEYILDKMADYLGHNNEKIRSSTENVYSNLPVYHLTNKEVCYRSLTVISKR